MNTALTNNWKEITKGSYNKHAEEFDKFTQIFRGKLQRFIDYFVDELEEGAKILDVGCGAGRDALYLTKKGLNVTGIDYSEKLIAIAKKKVKTAKFYVMDFEQLEFPKESFDGIWASSSLVHLPKNRVLRVLKKLYAILKTNGLIYVSFRKGGGERITHEKRGNAILTRFYSYYDADEAETLLNRAKFRNIRYEFDDIGIANWIGMFARK